MTEAGAVACNVDRDRDGRIARSRRQRIAPLALDGRHRATVQVQPVPLAAVGRKWQRHGVIDQDGAAGRGAALVTHGDGVGGACLSLDEVARVGLGDGQVGTRGDGGDIVDLRCWPD